MTVILTWRRPQTVAQKGLLIWCYSAEEVQAWNFLQLNYHVSWYIKTPMPATLPWTLAQTEAPKLAPLINKFVKLFRAGINEVKWNHFQKWSIFITRYSSVEDNEKSSSAAFSNPSNTQTWLDRRYASVDAFFTSPFKHPASFIYGVFSCLSPRVSVHSFGMLSRWVYIPLPNPPQVWHFFSPHPLPHLPCRLSHVLLCLSLILSYSTSSAFARRPPHTFSWFTFVFSLWKLSTLRISSFCGCPGLPCSCRSFQIHHTGMPRRFASLYSSQQSSSPSDNLCSSLTA